MTEKKPVTQAMRNELRKGFPDAAYSFLAHKPEFTTLKAMYITERLNDVFGLGRWTIEFNIVEKTAENIVLQGEFISYDYDIHVPKQFGGHSLNRKGMELADAYKSAVTDCQSKIVSYLEIGIDMFKGLIITPEQEKALQEKALQARKQNYNGYKQTQQKQPPKQEKKPQKQPTVKELQSDINKIEQGKIIKLPKRQKDKLTETHKNFRDCVKWIADGGKMDELRKRFDIDPVIEIFLTNAANGKEKLTDEFKHYTDLVDYLVKGGTMETLRKYFEFDKIVEKGLSNAAADLVFLNWQREQAQHEKQG